MLQKVHYRQGQAGWRILFGSGFLESTTQGPTNVLSYYLPIVILEQQSWPHPEGQVACSLNHSLWHARCPPWPHTGHQCRRPFTGLRHTLHIPAHRLQRVHHGEDTLSGNSMPQREHAVCIETPCKFIFDMYSSSDTEIWRNDNTKDNRTGQNRTEGKGTENRVKLDQRGLHTSFRYRTLGGTIVSIMN